MENLNIAVVCSSNMNRSMEAHAFLARKGFRVKSFGTGEKVRLPGTSADQPNCYEFGVSYEDIYNDLKEKDKEFYTKKGLLYLLKRNQSIKPCPEKFQMSNELFDVIITCEERVYDKVIEWFISRDAIYNHSVHIINMDIQDNTEQATIGAYDICDLVNKMAQSEDLDDDMERLLNDFVTKSQRAILNCIMFY